MQCLAEVHPPANSEIWPKICNCWALRLDKPSLGKSTTMLRALLAWMIGSIVDLTFQIQALFFTICRVFRPIWTQMSNCTGNLWIIPNALSLRSISLFTTHWMTLLMWESWLPNFTSSPKCSSITTIATLGGNRMGKWSQMCCFHLGPIRIHSSLCRFKEKELNHNTFRPICTHGLTLSLELNSAVRKQSTPWTLSAKSRMLREKREILTFQKKRTPFWRRLTKVNATIMAKHQHS